MKHFGLATISFTALAGAACFAPLSGQAGDALIFSNTRSRPNPAVLSKPAKEGELEVKQAPINPTIIQQNNVTTPQNPRTDRRARNARIEDKNWITFDKGELDARDEEKGKFGIRDDDPLLSEEEQLLEKAGRAERPGEPRLNNRLSRLPSTNLEGKPPARVAETTDTDKDQGKAGQPLFPKQGQAAFSKDMDLRGLLAPGKANSLAPADKAVASWQDIFGNRPKASTEEVGARDENQTQADRYRPPAAAVMTANAPQQNVALQFRNEFSSSRPDAQMAQPEKPDRNLNSIAPSSRNSLVPLAPSVVPNGPMVDFNRQQAGGPGSAINNPMTRPNGGFSPLTPPTPATPAYGPPPSSAPPRSGSGFNSLPTRPGYGR